MRHFQITLLLGSLAVAALAAQSSRSPDWSQLEQETVRHFQALIRMDTSDPPGNEKPAADYLTRVLQAEGIPVQTFALEPNRPNIVARLKGNGRKRPLLLMGHTDTVNVDPAKWTHGPFSADREEGYIYGRGTIDNKSTVVAALMIMLELKRLAVPLDRDVIFLAESGEEGTTRVGIQFMVDQHLADIDAEYCLAEGGSVSRENGAPRYATVQTTEKNPLAIELVARGVSGHASRPLESNPLVHLGAALARIGEWQPPISLNETTRTYFRRLAQISSGAAAERYRDVLDPAKVAEVDRYFRSNEPQHSALLHMTLSPTIIQGGYRLNVIPSEAKATVDLRILPDETPARVLELITKAVDDPAITVQFVPRDRRPVGISRLDTEAYRTIESAVSRHYNTTTIPAMSTGATDMAYLRGKGIQCYGIGVATDVEDSARGFGAHSDQERVVERELHRFVRFHWDVANELARAR